MEKLGSKIYQIKIVSGSPTKTLFPDTSNNDNLSISSLKHEGVAINCT